MGRRKKPPLNAIQSWQNSLPKRYQPRVSNIQERAARLVIPETKSPQYKSPFSSKRGIEVVPPDKVGVKPPRYKFKRDIKAPLVKAAAKGQKQHVTKKKQSIPPVIGAMRFQDGVRFVQGGLPELGRYR